MRPRCADPTGKSETEPTTAPPDYSFGPASRLRGRNTPDASVCAVRQRRQTCYGRNTACKPPRIKTSFRQRVVTPDAPYPFRTCTSPCIRGEGSCRPPPHGTGLPLGDAPYRERPPVQTLRKCGVSWSVPRGTGLCRNLVVPSPFDPVLRLGPLLLAGPRYHRPRPLGL